MILRNPRVLREITNPEAPHRFMSIRQLSRKAKVSDGFIYHLMNGKSGARRSTAERISAALGVDVDTLFVDESEGLS